MTKGKKEKAQKILIAGVPFGRDNVGDEAILECIVSIVKNACPNAVIWVSTDDREATEKKLDVKTVPLLGFDPPGYDLDDMIQAIEKVDAFIWAGATGLSDYPEIPLRLLQCAADRNKKTAIFCTGMNTALNPFLYKLLPGKRRNFYSLVSRLTFGVLDLIKRYEEQKRHYAVELMRRGIESAGLVILRDSQSRDEVGKFIGETKKTLSVGADPAIEIIPKSLATSRFSDDVKGFCNRPNPKIGLCISAQSPVRHLGELAELFEKLIKNFNVKIIGIPMNPITDANLMLEFRKKLDHPEAMCVAEGRFEPDEIAGLASEMDVIISSRLHLLILASITLTPFIGISRGSKITNFTSRFRLPEIGSVDTINIDGLEEEIIRLFDERDQFEKTASVVRDDMLIQLEEAKLLLSGHLASP